MGVIVAYAIAGWVFFMVGAAFILAALLSPRDKHSLEALIIGTGFWFLTVGCGFLGSHVAL